MANKDSYAKQHRTTFSSHWDVRFIAIIERTGVKVSEFLREAAKDKIVIEETKFREKKNAHKTKD